MTSRRHGGRPRYRVISAVVLLGLWPVRASALAQLSLSEALQATFPQPAEIERRTAFLSAEDMKAVGISAGPDVPLSQSVVTYYVARVGGKPLGVAYFDSHRVRTMNEVLMIVVNPDGRLRNIEVLRFAEPPEYRARDAWLKQFPGRKLTQELSLEGSIANMTGATLTSQAIVRATRRVLALHGRIRPFQSPARAGP